MRQTACTVRSNTYTYNEDGIRTSKTVNGVTTNYYLNDTEIIYQTDGTTSIRFIYDGNSELIGFNYNDANYFYVKNALGVINDIVDTNGNIIVSYAYDPYGKVLSISGNAAIGNINPFMYKSYYYDSDTELYYLQSRYYDPNVGRFINCDNVNFIGVSESEISYNPFAYCENDPINKYDPYGRKSYIKIPSDKTNNWNYIINKAIYLYENSKIFKGEYATLKLKDARGRIQKIKVPVYECKSATIYTNTGIFSLNYFNTYNKKIT